MSRVSGVSSADYSGQSLEAAIVISSLGNFFGIISGIVPCFLDANLVIYCSSKTVSYSTSFYNEFPLKEKKDSMTLLNHCKEDFIQGGGLLC